MKLTLLAICLFCTAAAFGQAVAGAGAVLQSQPQVYYIPSHPEHASHQAMAEEQSLIAGSNYTYAQGERPLWEVASKKVELPLGDVARMLRQEHATAKKAKKVVEN